MIPASRRVMRQAMFLFGLRTGWTPNRNFRIEPEHSETSEPQLSPDGGTFGTGTNVAFTAELKW